MLKMFSLHFKKKCHMLISFWNEIVGAPNYDRYLAHLQKTNANELPISEKEFYRKAIEEKYASKDIRRCC